MRKFWESRGRKPSRGSVSATAVVTVRMTGLSTWGPDCTMDQIIEQATDEVHGRIRRYEQSNREKLFVQDVKITAVYAPESER